MSVERAPNMRDVASRAGVSHQTVSRVLNAHPSIRPATRDRVLDAIAELGYRPNAVARALVTSRSRTIGVLGSLTGHYGPAVILAAVEAGAREAGYRVVITAPSSDDPGAVLAGLEFLLDQRVEAVVVLAPQRGALDALAALPDAVPAVALETASTGGRALDVDQAEGARLAVRHLVGLGHRRIALLTGPPDWSEALVRAEGFRAEMAASGLVAVAEAAGDWSSASGYRVGRELIATGGVTAVVAGNDQMALGLVAAARDAGVEVPGELSVVGFDDVPDAAFFAPPLTTVRQSLAELGRRAIAVLLAELDGSPVDLTPIPPELVVRESTAPAPGGHDAM